jgi:hypothetical protein
MISTATDGRVVVAGNGKSLRLCGEILQKLGACAAKCHITWRGGLTNPKVARKKGTNDLGKGINT